MSYFYYHCFIFIYLTFIGLQHFLSQYLHLHEGKIETTYINMTREKGKIQYYSTYSYLNLKMFYKLDY